MEIEIMDLIQRLSAISSKCVDYKYGEPKSKANLKHPNLAKKLLTLKKQINAELVEIGKVQLK